MRLFLDLDPRRRALAALTAAGLVVLTALVATGVTNPIDRYSTEHWMIDLIPRRHPLITFSGIALPDAHGTAAEIALAVWRYPASAAFSSFLLAACAWELLQRGQKRAAVTWCVLFAIGNLFELVGKLGITRPTLDAPIGRLPGFDHSFPSGHTIRALLVAAAVAYTWPRLRRPALAWGVTSPLTLVPLADHVPTDLVGGALVAALLLLVAAPVFHGQLELARTPAKAA
jgi:membrane-associated phospholipid phosphatase